jgi:hypothetical protein
MVPVTQENGSVGNLEEEMLDGHGTSEDSKGTDVDTSYPDGGDGDTSQMGRTEETTQRQARQSKNQKKDLHT